MGIFYQLSVSATVHLQHIAKLAGLANTCIKFEVPNTSLRGFNCICTAYSTIVLGLQSGDDMSQQLCTWVARCDANNQLPYHAG